MHHTTQSTTQSEIPLQVMATLAALQLIDTLRARHGELLFHQSGGCCDGSSPMCFPVGDFIVGDRDVLLGEIGGAPFYISASQFDYWKHTQLIIDVVPGRGGMFSLENGEGVRFLVRSRLFADEEFARLQEAGRA
ncbi:acetaldehyde dehydrogenase [Xanthomonas sp. Leaf131]|nr:acetaldehyde dehydrogenase [Xanthomonas sp. Leaf131]